MRTAGKMQFVVKLLDTVEGSLYHRIATEALRLKQLGLSMAGVARALDVSDKTATKAIKWLEGSHFYEQD